MEAHSFPSTSCYSTPFPLPGGGTLSWFFISGDYLLPITTYSFWRFWIWWWDGNDGRKGFLFGRVWWILTQSSCQKRCLGEFFEYFWMDGGFREDRNNITWAPFLKKGYLVNVENIFSSLVFDISCDLALAPTCLPSLYPSRNCFVHYESESLPSDQLTP